MGCVSRLLMLFYFLPFAMRNKKSFLSYQLCIDRGVDHFLAPGPLRSVYTLLLLMWSELETVT